MPAPLSSQNDYFRGIFLFPVVDPAANEATGGNRGDHLAGRRKKDRERYAAMTDDNLLGNTIYSGPIESGNRVTFNEGFLNFKGLMGELAATVLPGWSPF